MSLRHQKEDWGRSVIVIVIVLAVIILTICPRSDQRLCYSPRLRVQSRDLRCYLASPEPHLAGWYLWRTRHLGLLAVTEASECSAPGRELADLSTQAGD